MSAIEDARRLVAEAEAVAVLTGAGISTDSGIPDFRGPNGVWTKNPGAEKSANIQNYLADPEVRKRTWRNRLDSQAWTAEPNDGHRALVDLERQGKLHTLITQNIDGLHQAAGSDPDLVVEVHGTIREVGCLNCGERAPMERALDRVRAGEEDPDVPYLWRDPQVGHDLLRPVPRGRRPGPVRAGRSGLRPPPRRRLDPQRLPDL